MKWTQLKLNIFWILFIAVIAIVGYYIGYNNSNINNFVLHFDFNKKGTDKNLFTMCCYKFNCFYCLFTNFR